MYAPLQVDADLEADQRSGLWNSLLRRIQRWSPLLIHLDPPYGRSSAENQLKERTLFPAAEWASFGNPEEVRGILSIIAEQLAWPNSNFVPEDPLALVMTGHDLDDLYAILELEQKLGVVYSDDDLARIRSEAWTLGQFVCDLMDRARAAQRDEPS